MKKKNQTHAIFINDLISIIIIAFIRLALLLILHVRNSVIIYYYLNWRRTDSNNFAFLTYTIEAQRARREERIQECTNESTPDLKFKLIKIVRNANNLFGWKWVIWQLSYSMNIVEDDVEDAQRRCAAPNSSEIDECEYYRPKQCQWDRDYGCDKAIEPKSCCIK